MIKGLAGSDERGALKGCKQRSVMGQSLRLLTGV